VIKKLPRFAHATIVSLVFGPLIHLDNWFSTVLSPAPQVYCDHEAVSLTHHHFTSTIFRVSYRIFGGRNYRWLVGTSTTCQPLYPTASKKKSGQHGLSGTREPAMLTKLSSPATLASPTNHLPMLVQWQSWQVYCVHFR